MIDHSLADGLITNQIEIDIHDASLRESEVIADYLAKQGFFPALRPHQPVLGWLLNVRRPYGILVAHDDGRLGANFMGRHDAKQRISAYDATLLIESDSFGDAFDDVFN